MTADVWETDPAVELITVKLESVTESVVGEWEFELPEMTVLVDHGNTIGSN